MNKSTEIDAQAQCINDGLRTLHDLLDKPISRSALDIAQNADTSSRYDVLRRVRQSLRQYLGRDGDLFYIGLLGHFSAGKSSTINSLLGAWESKNERITGLHPTDTTITLITQGKNGGALLGVIHEGHVTIRHQAVESPMLDSLVLADTPGTGDPQFIEEVARDFLPICDVILFLFSAASPLDKSDLPLLTELQKRLQFVPLRFVVTRADELRKDFSKPLDIHNLDQKKTEEFLSDVVTRVNAVMKPQIYTPQDFILIDNKTQFNVDVLRAYLEARCNSSSAQARVSMHANKLRYYLSAAKELKGFFASFLDTKLNELNKIVTAAARNVKKYQEIVQISNNNLTRAWIDFNTAINQARDKALDSIPLRATLPPDYTAFSQVIKKRAEVTEDEWRHAKFASTSIISNLRSEAISTLRDHCYKTQKAIADTPLADLTARSHNLETIRLLSEFKRGDFVSPGILSLKSNDIRESQEEALRDALGDLRKGLRELEELVQERAPLATCEATIETARDSLTKDLNQFFQNVELYRSGVFSHTTKESISTLGIGEQLDALESEFVDEDKTSFVSAAATSLFPGYNDFATKSAADLVTLSGRVRAVIEQGRAAKVEKPQDNFRLIEEAANRAESNLFGEIVSGLQADIDRLCGSISLKLASVLVKAKSNYDDRVRIVRSRRKRRYAIIAGVTGLAVLAVEVIYHFLSLPAPKSTVGNVAINVASGLLVELIVLLGVKVRENVPKIMTETQQEFQTNLNNEVRKVIDEELRSADFEALNAVSIPNRIFQIYENILALTADAWHTSAADSMRTLKKFQEEYLGLRRECVSFIEGTREQCSPYFSDPSRNLEILNGVASQIKEKAIEPSFGLLNRTKEELELVKKDVESVEFA